MRITVLRELGPGGHVLHADIVVGTERKGFSAEEILVEIDPREHLQDEEAEQLEKLFSALQTLDEVAADGKGATLETALGNLVLLGFKSRLPNEAPV